MAAALLTLACGSSITSEPQPAPSNLLDSSQPRTDSSVTISATGVSPQVLHLNAPVTVRFTNADSAAHRVEPAPELRFDNCPEFNQVGTLEPGQTGEATFTRTVLICAYHDAAGPQNVAFQGLVVLH